MGCIDCNVVVVVVVAVVVVKCSVYCDIDGLDKMECLHTLNLADNCITR